MYANSYSRYEYESIIFPNPTKGKFTVSLILDKPSDVVIGIYTNSGKQIYLEEFIEANQGVNLMKFNLKDYTTGIYNIAIFVNGKMIKDNKLLDKRYSGKVLLIK